ncbi:hypothetical protein RchiOBHm_Chr2g0108141 [Rosa chinensis]|uniref:Uncharacterized protein n=1 Tax=Rosa chinensis TaxID=74649 RepID=A0A2P6RP41_ROSCH|nr:hypothetical protein RchiOBHm_Chr2g0108141 [Rosa chinensis]
MKTKTKKTSFLQHIKPQQNPTSNFNTLKAHNLHPWKLCKDPSLKSQTTNSDQTVIKSNATSPTKAYTQLPKSSTLSARNKSRNTRKLNRVNEQDPPLSESQSQALSEETHFQTLKAEYKSFTRAVKSKNGGGELTVGMPWERVERIGFRELASSSGEYGGEKLKKEELNALREMFETRKREELKWVLDDHVEIKEEWFDGENRVWDPTKRRRGGGDSVSC